uniref:Uncharacterized protein n=1 Tax=Sinocyclocheilus anshuiensis TaxID=1608454 RepID=A0A671QKE2_9TELE
MESVNSNLQTGFDFQQLTSTSSECISVGNRGENSVVYSRLNNTACLCSMYFKELTIFLIPRQSRSILLLWEPLSSSPTTTPPNGAELKLAKLSLGGNSEQKVTSSSAVSSASSLSSLKSSRVSVSPNSSSVEHLDIAVTNSGNPSWVIDSVRLKSAKP